MGLIAKKRGAHKRVKEGTTGGTDSCFARKRGAAVRVVKRSETTLLRQRFFLPRWYHPLRILSS